MENNLKTPVKDHARPQQRTTVVDERSYHPPRDPSYMHVHIVCCISCVGAHVRYGTYRYGTVVRGTVYQVVGTYGIDVRVLCGTRKRGRQRSTSKKEKTTD
jgi:hypothetical protein